MSVDILYGLGDDALENLYDCIIPPFPGVLNPVQLQFRIQGFTIPATGVSEYEIHWKTDKIKKPGGKIEDEKTFSFEFRVDKYWTIYNGLKNWKNLIANTRTGVIGPDDTGLLRIPITVISTDSLNIPTGGKWIFEGCWLKSLGEIAFSNTGEEPVTCSVTMNYLTLNDIL